MDNNVGENNSGSDDLHHIEWLSKYLQSEIDSDKVNKLLQANSKKSNSIDLGGINMLDQSPEEIAMRASIIREQAEKKPEIFMRNLAQGMYKLVDMGLTYIKSLGEYWRFKPCVEKILEIDADELSSVHKYLHSFQESDYMMVLRPHHLSFYDHASKWGSGGLTAENIGHGIDMYRDVIAISERGFPNLLAFKRILDGEKPDNDVLQRKSASSVRYELTNTDKHLNSAYFDLIVKEFDTNLRNGISHGDIIIEPHDKEIRIPTSNTIYTYEKFFDILTRNHMNIIFLTGLFESLVDIRVETYGNEDTIREIFEL